LTRRAARRIEGEQAAPEAAGDELDLDHQGPRDPAAAEIGMDHQLVDVCPVRLICGSVMAELRRADDAAVRLGDQQDARPVADAR
jgi:hypothetical protein